MTIDSLESSLQQLRLTVEDLETPSIDARVAEEEEFGSSDDIRSQKRNPQSTEELKTELENEFLTPSPRFSPDWLNRLQRLVLSLFCIYHYYS